MTATPEDIAKLEAYLASQGLRLTCNIATYLRRADQPPVQHGWPQDIWYSGEQKPREVTL